MLNRLPPLTALRAFDAAARHMSFANAASELNVTAAALSFQIKSLEEHLGQPVFRRLNRAVELTEAGRALAPGAADGFQTLATAWRAAQRLANTTTLTITAGPGFTAKWLAPRLFDFAQKHPKIELRFSATLRLMDFNRDEVDVAIRFGEGPDKGLYSRDIINEWMTPMMTPELAALYPTPQSLMQATLLHQDDYNFAKQISNWSIWFRAAGLPSPGDAGPRFSQSDHAHDAAATGSGVVLGRYSLSERDLKQGQLVAPFDLAIALPARYRFICPEGAETRPQVAAFEEWIVSEAAKMTCFAKSRHMVALSDVVR